jgi:peroxiredoxin Q/BCP
VILGASFDTPAENKAFAEKYGFDYPLLCDTTRALGLAYGACKDAGAKYADRITYIIDADGTIESAEKVKDISAHVESAVHQLCGIRG